ncbi:hypothetical protein F8M41_010470 [Gigaspora margarita]|uniref:Uncharacterized protein n=1 Tax=Gigaspora margarita TaxID=4874 RepID=A0A8H4EQ50_GIGMA|nr:hypothetical protein F8M41_010470 [Gigaspora margarita]
MSKILNSRCAYGITNGLCKKAISVGLDAGITAIETLNKFFENFIRQNSVNPECVSTNSVENNIRSDNESDESDLDISQENDLFFNISTVQDPVVRKRKGALRVKHIKSSSEPKTSHSNNNGSLKEKAKGICFCSYCKQPNHYYAKTCTIAL